MRAYGIRRGKIEAMSRKRKAAVAHSRLSQAGNVHRSGAMRVDPPLMTSEKPAPTWIPLTTATGTTRCSHASDPVSERKRTAKPIVNPAAETSSRDNFWEIAMAAMAFIGWTGRGRPKKRPVRMLARPENTRVDGREMEDVRVRAIIKGRRVPRSPREPESSARGAERRVERLWRVIRRRWVEKPMLTETRPPDLCPRAQRWMLVNNIERCCGRDIVITWLILVDSKVYSKATK